MVAKARRARGEGGLFQRADGKWVGRCYVPGPDGTRERKQIVRRSQADAIEALDKLKADARAGRVAPSGASAYTVEKWLAHWIDDIHRDNLAPGTFADYKRVIRLHIVPHIGRVRLDKLTSEDVLRMQRAVQKSTTRTAQIAHVVINRALTDAVAWDAVHRNVAAVVPTPKHRTKKRKGFKTDVARHIIATAGEIVDQAATPGYETRWAAAFLTGARQGELLGLTWDRVDLDEGTIDLAWQLQQLEQAHGCGEQRADGTWECGRQRPGWCPERHWDLHPGFEYEVVHRSLCFTRPKTDESTRLVPLVPELCTALRTQRATAQPGAHNLVWSYADGRPISPRDDYTRWQALLVEAGVRKAKEDGGEAVPLHQARNTTATLLLEAGVDAHVIQSIVGHADVVTTRGYQHVDLSLQRAALANLRGLMGAA
ncbi:tyrosine integrase [Mycobacterium phage ShedlockHolmes]|uniref:Integrase n=1 Tax=Mycobacterium phage ShedlockHolmes TaxID=1647313 RepID=A0A0F6YRM4_9CAUD|nr:integrase [Mycobacterium phage ShedlockHolmes]AKF15220.1 tyrosine integrase [Mycobacterium phage ShedlockHolmes]